MKCKRLFLAWLLSLMLIGTFIIFVPEVKALTVSDVIVSFTPPYGTVQLVMTDRAGNMYYGNGDGEVYKSTDGGTTWTTFFNEYTTGKVTVIAELANGDFLVHVIGVTGGMWRYNGTWHKVLNTSGLDLFHYDQMDNGTFLVNVYAASQPDITYATDDNGDSWRQINTTEQTGSPQPYHTHSLRVNPYNQDIWWTTGDTGAQIQIIKYNGSWTNYYYASGEVGNDAFGRIWKVDLTFDENYVYFGSDTGKDKIARMPHDGDPRTDLVTVLRSDEWVGGVHFIRYMRNVDGILMASTGDGMIWASWDGEHWVSLVNYQQVEHEARNFGWYRTKDGAIIGAHPYINKIYKFYVDEKVLKHLFFKDSVAVNGNSVDINHVFKNGSDMSVDLGTYGLSNANITLSGVSHELVASNGTFESGSLDGWYERWDTISITSDAYEGSYALNFTQGIKDAKWLSVYAPEFHVGNIQKWIPKKGYMYVFNFWAKSNITATGNYFTKFEWRNSTYDQGESITIEPLDTTWRQYRWASLIPSWATNFTFQISNDVENGSELILDNFLLERWEGEVYNAGGDYRQYLGGWASDTVFTANKTTENPSVTIDGTVKSHSGSLAEGADSTTTSISLNSGILDVTTSVTTSPYVRVIIQGTQSYSVTNAIIKNRIASGLYNATYYGTPTVTTTTNLLILADMNSSVPSASLTSTSLTLTVSGYSGLSSLTLIYVGDRGEPNSVTGATSSSYDSATNILTVTVNHASPATIEIDWSSPPWSQILGYTWVSIGLLSLLPIMFAAVFIMAMFNKKDELTLVDLGLGVGVIVVLVVLLFTATIIINAFINVM